MNRRYGGYDLDYSNADYYDFSYEQRRPLDVGFFLSYARQSGGETLELGCGTGRVLIPIAREGFRITGLDLSDHMLRVCRQKLEMETDAVRDRVTIIRGDMTSFDTGRHYALVTIPFRPFQHLITLQEQKDCLFCIRKHLEPGGKLVFDVFNPYPPRLVRNEHYTQEIEDIPPTTLPDGRVFRRTGRMVDFHRHEQYNDVEMMYYVTHPDGREERIVQSFPMRYFFRYELEHLLELCGFKILELFGDFDSSPYSNDSPEIITVAEKRD